MLMGLYLLILLRGFWIGLRAQTSFGRMMAGSLTLTFFVYIFVNMGMVAGLLPVVGVPLPLVSAGGTSVVTLMAGFGILMAVSTEKRMVAQHDEPVWLPLNHIMQLERVLLMSVRLKTTCVISCLWTAQSCAADNYCGQPCGPGGGG